MTPRQDQTAFFESAYTDEECGCPVEDWMVNGVTLSIHFEPDGSLEVFADTGDWDMTFPLKASNMSDGRREAFAWARALPFNPDA